MEITLSALMGEKLEEIQKKQLLQLLAQFENLEKLKIDLSLQYKKQEEIRDLLIVLQKISKLQNLDLNLMCCYSGEGKSNIYTQQFRQFTQLRNLKLTFCETGFVNDDVLFLGESLKSLKLQSLILKFNNRNLIEKDCMLKFGQQLRNIQTLENLQINLELNPIEQEGAVDLCTGLKGLQNLKSLKLEFSECFIVGSVNKLFQELQELKNLKKFEIDLSNNNISSEDGQYFGKELKNFQNLEILRLQLQGNEIEIEKDGYNQIGQGIKQINGLKELLLNYSYSKIKEESVLDTISYIKQLKGLNKLVLLLWGNKLDEKEKMFVDQFKDLKELKKIDIPTTYRELK